MSTGSLFLYTTRCLALGTRITTSCNPVAGSGSAKVAFPDTISCLCCVVTLPKGTTKI